MGAAISVEEYLRTSFEGRDREYVEGEVVERGLSDEPHSRTQWRLSGLIWDLSKTLPLHGRPELRLRLRATLIRIPDVCIFSGVESIETQPPLVAIEILSPDDRHSELMRKFEEYSEWGVRHIWLVDPESGKLKVYAHGSLTEVSALEIPEFTVQLTAAQIFG